MHYRLVHRSLSVLSRTGLTSARLIVAVTMLFGTMAVGLPGAGAQSGSGFEYDEGGLTWSVDYDDSVWTDGSADTADLSLTSDNGSISQFLTLPDVNEDPAGCLTAVVPRFEEGAGFTSSTPYKIDSGDPIAGATDAYAYEIDTVESDTLSGLAVHVCFALDDASVVWGVTLVPDGVDDLDAVYALYDSVSIDGESTPIGLPDGDAGESTGNDATPVASDEGTPASSDGTPAAGNGTPTASGAGADEDAGTYESQTYGYTLSWDADNWTVEADNETNRDYPRDYLQLFNVDQTSVIYIEGTDGEWADTDACVRSLLDEVNVNTRSNAAVDDPETGDPYKVSENDRSAAAYTTSQDGTDITVLADCRQDPGSDLIVGFTSISNEVDDYFGVEYPAVEDILNSLEF